MDDSIERFESSAIELCGIVGIWKVVGVAGKARKKLRDGRALLLVWRLKTCYEDMRWEVDSECKYLEGSINLRKYSKWRGSFLTGVVSTKL